MTAPSPRPATFKQELLALLELARAAHEESGHIQGLEFADERGWISDAERQELSARITRYRAIVDQLGPRITELGAHPDWRSYVQRGIRVFEALEARHASLNVPGRSDEDRRFDALICKSLLAAWSAILDGREADHSLAWAFSVGDKLRDLYEKHI